MPEIIVIGGGGHAKVLICILRKMTSYKILGYTDHKDKGGILGVPFIGNDSVLSDIKKNNQACQAAIGIGNVKINNTRMNLFLKLKDLGFELPAIISPHAVVNEDVLIGEASVVYDGAVINSGSRLSKMCIVNTNSSIDHDCIIGGCVHIAPGVTLSGSVTVGNNSMIGIGSCVVQNVRIGDNCMIGGGSVVVKDCLEPGVYFGNPAKRVHGHE